MDYGVHLPIISFDGQPFTLEGLLDYTEAAERLGYKTLAVSDHLLSFHPWLDGPSALTTVLTRTKRMTLMTSTALPVVRGPVPLAKTMTAIDVLSKDVLSNGRLVVGIGPGSTARDYVAVGVPFEERWRRFWESVQALRTLFQGNDVPFKGKFCSTEGVSLEPLPAQRNGPPIWIGVWVSEVGLKQLTRYGDGWLASAIHGTPELFKKSWKWLQENLSQAGKDPLRFPNAVSTMYFYVTEDPSKKDRVLRGLLKHFVPPDSDLPKHLPVGPVRHCAEVLVAYKEAGVQRVLLWPVADEIDQLTVFQEQVAPLMR